MLRAVACAFAVAAAAYAFGRSSSGGSSGSSDTAPELILPRTYGLSLHEAEHVMVLIGGWPDTHVMWEPSIVRAFESAYHIVSLTTPDFDRPEGLRNADGYSFTTVPRMLQSSLDAHLGSRKAEVMTAHDWGAIWAYYLVQVESLSRRTIPRHGLPSACIASLHRHAGTGAAAGPGLASREVMAAEHKKAVRPSCTCPTPHPLLSVLNYG
jgi:hypothetical protein